jgi:glyoxylase-like metal-dependent hydrolase (beta-lactamase superfamily II)
MKIKNLTLNSSLYTSNVYLVLGTWNAISDVNTLIDVGCDKGIVAEMEAINTGLGKNKIDQVILTHSHSDHTALLQEIKAIYNPRVFAFNLHLKDVDCVLKDGDLITIGDKVFEVFHLTFHSHDSICLYCETEAVLFSGDTNFPVLVDNNLLIAENERALKRLFTKKIHTVFPGHGLSLQFSEKKFQLLKRLIVINQ